ncbi:MAG: indole-3-glycerol phosphate synthase TrpC [Fimbriimonadaceae bacterium]
MLSRIFECKHAEVAAAKAAKSLQSLQGEIAGAAKPRGFLRALQRANDVALIAEVKMASPSQGVIRPDFDAAEIAGAYESAGAHAISVLTDHKYFQGSAGNLKSARRGCGLPVLRKDFIDDPYQVFEARAWGADAVLLIVAALEQSQLVDLHALVLELGMDALVEVHTLGEAHRVLEAKLPFVGINNRDLGTFTTDLTYTETLAPLLCRHAYTVSESGLERREDIDRVVAAGAQAVLIGTTFCAAPDIGAKVREVMQWQTPEGL